MSKCDHAVACSCAEKLEIALATEVAKRGAAERERDEARIAEAQARDAVLKAGRSPEWAAIYAWLDDNKDEMVKRLSDETEDASDFVLWVQDKLAAYR